MDKIGSSGLSRGTLAAQYIQNLSNKNWNSKKWMYGSCNVNIDIQVSYGVTKTNNLNIIDADISNPKNRSYTNSTIYPNHVVSNSGMLNIRDKAAIVHETGHLMGLPDQYDDINGKSVSRKGWGNNIIGQYDMPVEQKNINDIININLNKQQIGGCGCGN